MPTTSTTTTRWGRWRLAVAPVTCTGCGRAIPLAGWVRGDGHGAHQCGPCDGRPLAPGVHC